MKNHKNLLRFLILGSVVLLLLVSCKKIKQYDHKPELESLRQGLKTSMAIAYCASIVNAIYEGETLPDNILHTPGSGLAYVRIDKDNPLPLNKEVGDIAIAFQCDDRGGLMSVVFGDLNPLGKEYKLYGLYLVPFIRKENEQGLRALYMRQDIILGNGSDTILDLSNISISLYNDRMDRFGIPDPSDVFVAVKQNFWVVDIAQNGSSHDLYDMDVNISGGGQIAEVQGNSGGVIYHALLNARYNFNICSQNPISGAALSQNFKAGGAPYIDLGNSYISFTKSCDGKAFVDFSSGKYTSYFKKSIDLGLE